MNKILAEVYFPSLACSYDIYIPDRVRFYQIADMIERAASRLTHGRYTVTGCAVLCDRDSGLVYDPNRTAEEVMLHSGSRLMIM